MGLETSRCRTFPHSQAVASIPCGWKGAVGNRPRLGRHLEVTLVHPVTLGDLVSFWGLYIYIYVLKKSSIIHQLSINHQLFPLGLAHYSAQNDAWNISPPAKVPLPRLPRPRRRCERILMFQNWWKMGSKPLDLLSGPFPYTWYTWYSGCGDFLAQLTDSAEPLENQPTLLGEHMFAFLDGKTRVSYRIVLEYIIPDQIPLIVVYIYIIIYIWDQGFRMICDFCKELFFT